MVSLRSELVSAIVWLELAGQEFWVLQMRRRGVGPVRALPAVSVAVLVRASECIRLQRSPLSVSSQERASRCACRDRERTYADASCYGHNEWKNVLGKTHV